MRSIKKPSLIYAAPCAVKATAEPLTDHLSISTSVNGFKTVLRYIPVSTEDYFPVTICRLKYYEIYYTVIMSSYDGNTAEIEITSDNDTDRETENITLADRDSEYIFDLYVESVNVSCTVSLCIC